MTFAKPFFYPTDWIFALLEHLNRPAPTDRDRDAAKMTVRDYLLDCDPSACQSEHGAQMLMAMFPREV